MEIQLKSKPILVFDENGNVIDSCDLTTDEILNDE